MVAKTSLCSSMSEASLNMRFALSVVLMSRHDGSLKAFLAAATATSMSSGPAACTDAISLSSLYRSISLFSKVSKTHVGLIEVILAPAFDFTNSLLMNRPRGCLYLTPLGAVKSTNRSSDILN